MPQLLVAVVDVAVAAVVAAAVAVVAVVSVVVVWRLHTHKHKTPVSHDLRKQARNHTHPAGQQTYQVCWKSQAQRSWQRAQCSKRLLPLPPRRQLSSSPRQSRASSARCSRSHQALSLLLSVCERADSASLACRSQSRRCPLQASSLAQRAVSLLVEVALPRQVVAPAHS